MIRPFKNIFRYLYLNLVCKNLNSVKCTSKNTESQNKIETREKENGNDKLGPDISLPKCFNGQIIFPEGKLDGSCYKTGAVSSEVPICSKLGTEILQNGGNAVDAAIATAICVGIINSFSSGIGGGGFMLIKGPNTKNRSEPFIDMIDFRETAPANISETHFNNKTDQTKVGGRAVGVPGEIKGLWEAHKKYGKMKWADLFTKNIEIAKKFEVSDQLGQRLKKFKDVILKDPGLKEIYTKNNELVKAKDIISRLNYAQTLQQIAINPKSFYEGDIADSMILSIKEQGGVMEKSDLEQYKAVFREPLTSKFYDYDIYTTNLPSSGLFIIEALNILEHFDVKQMKKISEEIENEKKYPHYHVLVEIFKFIAAKRGKMQDPDFMDNWKEEVDKIVDKKTAAEIAKKIDLNKVLDDKEYGFEGLASDDHGTTHLNVIDKDEMIVSLTSTVNLEFGAKFMCKKTGIIFNNEMDDFYVPKVKNAFDLAPMPNNLIKPRKRPFSSAAPFILSKDDEYIVLGAAGGTRIPTTLIKVIFDLVLNKSLPEAIAEYRIHNQYHPAITYLERGFDEDIKKYLEDVGHKTQLSEQNTIFTSVQGIHVVKGKGNNKIIQAVSDKRKGGLAYGY